MEGWAGETRSWEDPPSPENWLQYLNIDRNENLNDNPVVNMDARFAAISAYQACTTLMDSTMSEDLAGGRRYQSTSNAAPTDTGGHDPGYTAPLPHETLFRSAVEQHIPGMVPAHPMAPEAPTLASGPIFSFAMYNDASRTLQPVTEQNVDGTDSSPSPLMQPSLTWSPTVDAPYYPQAQPTNEGYFYPQRLDLEDMDSGEQNLPPVLPDRTVPFGRRPSLSRYTMERSFPGHMYDADVVLLNNFDASPIGTPSSAYTSNDAALSPFSNVQTPATSQISQLQLDTSTYALCQSAAATPTNVSADPPATLQQFMHLSDYAPAELHEGTESEHQMNVYVSPSSALCRSRSVINFVSAY